MAQATEVTGRICAAIADQVVTHDGRSIQVTVSIGVAALLPGETIEQWLSRSDKAPDQAKRDAATAVLSPAEPRKGQMVLELFRPFMLN